MGLGRRKASPLPAVSRFLVSAGQGVSASVKSLSSAQSNITRVTSLEKASHQSPIFDYAPYNRRPSCSLPILALSLVTNAL